ncbi:MAG TPA: 23S rRNA (adenine(2503)-C(2))-methyltransferase RlmN [Acidimicrobiales bacterium]|nr:23S rRNA (adenine(2503)-C(2))-methyltransferase RlmN [Acidimicrobiales bacterium]
MNGPYDLSRDDLEALLDGEPAYRARQVWEALHKRAVWPAEMTELPRALRDRLSAQIAPALSLVDRRIADGGETVKWAFDAGDATLVETVLMAYPDRVTVCVSTQAGCAMACPFCATGQGGFKRHLRSGEIVEQVAWAMRERPVTHVVFMGMGEPLANYDQTMTALRRLHDHMGLSARRLTVSTVGIVPGIKRLGAEGIPVNLAVSLHAANDELRNELVPINRRYPLSMLALACAEYVERTGRRLSLEWAVIGGVNDRAQDARELADFARPLGAHVNLIPLNETDGYRAPGRPRASEFRSRLGRLGVNATVRVTRGADIAAACGQLAGSVKRP